MHWSYQESLYTVTSTLEGGRMSAVLHRDMALDLMGPTPSSLLTQMSSSNMAILRRGHTFESLESTGAILIRVKKLNYLGGS